jgi:hypothetical protein
MTADLFQQKARTFGIYLLIASVLVGLLHMFELWDVDGHGVSAVSKKLAEWDFSNMWFGGRLALTGRLATIFDAHAYRDFIATIAPYQRAQSEWSYPPSILLIAAPLAIAPLLASYLVWTFGTTALLFGTLRITGLPRSLTIAAIASPAAWTNIMFGQNGSLSATFLCGGLLLLEDNPVMAGVLFGLLTFKPHLGVIIPICLIASRKWSAILSASLVAGAMIVATAICFGWQSWSLFLSATRPLMVDILEHPPEGYQVNFVTFFMLLRSFDLSIATAWLGQGVVALIAAAAVWKAWRMETDDKWTRIALTIIATFVATPYGYSYDLVSFSVAVTMIAWTTLEDAHLNQRFKSGVLILLGFLWFWPKLQQPVVDHLWSYQVPALVILIAFAIGCWRMFAKPDLFGESLSLRSGDGGLDVSTAAAIRQ